MARYVQTLTSRTCLPKCNQHTTFATQFNNPCTPCTPCTSAQDGLGDAETTGEPPESEWGQLQEENAVDALIRMCRDGVQPTSQVLPQTHMAHPRCDQTTAPDLTHSFRPLCLCVCVCVCMCVCVASLPLSLPTLLFPWCCRAMKSTRSTLQSWPMSWPRKLPQRRPLSSVSRHRRFCCCAFLLLLLLSSY